MCGIAAILPLKPLTEALESTILESKLLRMLAAIKHRGDPFNFAELYVDNYAALGTNRLEILDRAHGKQPISDETGHYLIILNGEIYNHNLLRHELIAKGFKFKSATDTEVLLYGYKQWGKNIVNKLDGIFAFVIYDKTTGEIFAARDHIGIKPLYYAVSDSLIYFASEQKSFIGTDFAINDFPPGSFYADGKIHQYIKFQSLPKAITSEVETIAHCRTLLENAVKKQTNTDLPIGVIFSGGLDSTIVLYLALKYHSNVTAFSIGTSTSSDLAYAKRYCENLKIPHVITYITDEQLERNIEHAIYQGEFFEPVDISDMVAMSTVYSVVRSHGIKVALSGDGSDELFAGYDLFKRVNNPEMLTTYRINNLYRTDLQRADRSSMAHSVECRVPFLDREVMQFACALPFDLKIRANVEKYILREAFRGEIPDDMLDRPKIRMPHGIGIHDKIFQRLGTMINPTKQFEPAILIDSPQVKNSLQQYINCGFKMPKERYKMVDQDYHAGGYFDFNIG